MLLVICSSSTLTHLKPTIAIVDCNVLSNLTTIVPVANEYTETADLNASSMWFVRFSGPLSYELNSLLEATYMWFATVFEIYGFPIRTH